MGGQSAWQITKSELRLPDRPRSWITQPTSPALSGGKSSCRDVESLRQLFVLAEPDKSPSPASVWLHCFKVWGEGLGLNSPVKTSRTLWRERVGSVGFHHRGFCVSWQLVVISPSTTSVTAWICHRCRGPFSVSVWDQAESGAPNVSESLQCVRVRLGAASTIHIVQTATSFRHTFKDKVSSSRYTACTHYAVLYIDPRFICWMLTSLCFSCARYLERLQIFGKASHCARSICHLGKQVNYWGDYFFNQSG